MYITRLKSFAWRLGMMSLAFAVAYIVENISVFELPPEVTIVAGLVLGEVSKYLNNIATR